MNAENHYNSLVSRCTLDSLYETHHILPRCLGGKDSVINLVRLSPEDHVMCHYLLTLIYPKCVPIHYAYQCMVNTKGYSVDLTSVVIAQYRESSSIRSRNMRGSNNPNYGRSLSSQTKSKLSRANSGSRHPNYDREIYSFSNKDGRNFEGRRHNFIKKYGLRKSNVSEIISGKRKSHKGWYLN